MKRYLWITAPGLFGPVNDPEGARAFLPELPALSQLLSRARPRAGFRGEGETLVARRFGLQAAGTRSLAAVSVLGEDDPRTATVDAESNWLRTDPVHLRADMAQVRMFGPWGLELDRTEVDALSKSVAELLAERDMSLITPAPDRWYVCSRQPIDLDCHVPADVSGRNADPFMPAGPSASEWNRLLTEIQMVLHAEPVNAARTERGALPVNSVWAWGSGPLPVLPASERPAAIFSNEPLARGFGRLADIPIQSIPSPDDEPSWPVGTSLATDFTVREPLHHGDAEAWFRALEALEQQWFVPVLAQLQQGKLDGLVVSGGTGTDWQVSRQSLRFGFWRRRRDWQRWLALSA